MYIPFRLTRVRALSMILFVPFLMAQGCPEFQDLVGLNVKIEGFGGTVDPCCSGVYKRGTVVRLTATPEVGYQFKNWRGNEGVGMSTNPVLDVLMDRDKQIIATFELIPPNPLDLKSTAK